MTKLFTCENGHRWHAADDPLGLVGIACPRCGMAAITLADPGASTSPDADTGPPGESPPPREPLPVPGYELLGELGRGGMGVVYKARQVALDRTVALKMIRDPALAGPDAVARFKTEAGAIARLQHPNIVQIHEVGSAGGDPYFALEFVPGGTLARRLGDGPLPARDAAALTETLARAVHAAHAAGVVHRDLKPGNVLLTADGRPKLTDFGLARLLRESAAADRLTHTGSVMGTPSYMAPEQAAGRTDVGPAADVYALGAILYELLTGRPPFRGATPMDTLDQVRTRDPVSVRRLQPSAPRDLETVCQKCLRKAPADRYPSAEALADDLARFLAGRAIVARPVGPVERARLWVGRNPAVATLLALLALALAGGFAGILWQLERVKAREAQSAANADRAGRNAGHALRAADALVSELARGVRPLAGTQSPAVEAILDRAARVYDDLLREEESPAVLAGRARMLTMFADLYLELDRTARASAAADEAVASFERLRADHPDAPGYAVGLARALEQQGNVAVQQGQVPAAVDAYRRAVDLFARVPDDPDARHGLAVVRLRYGYMLWLQNDLDGARREVEAGDALARELVAQAPDDPDLRRTAALAREKVGDVVYYVPGRLADAGAAYAEAVAAFRALADAEPANAERQVDVIRSASSLAEYHLEKGESARARALLTDALTRARRLHDADPSNGRRHNMVLRPRALLLSVRAREDPKTDLSAEQRALLEEDITVMARLAARDPENANWRNRLAGQRLQLAQSYVKLAEAGTEPGANAGRAWDLITRVVSAQRELIDRDPTNAGLTVILTAGYKSLAALARTGLRPVAETRPVLEDARRWLRDARGRVRFASDPGPVLEAIEKALADRK